MRRLFAALCAALLMASLAPATAADESPFEISVILSLTGPGAFLGTAEAKTLGAVERLVNRTGGIQGHPVHFAITDDQSSPQIAVQLASELKTKGVAVIMGPSYSATCYAVLPLVKTGPVQYCYTPSVHTTTPSFTFSASVSTKDLAFAGIRWLRLRGLTKLALLVTTDATGQDGENVIREDLAAPENRSVNLVATEHFTPGDISIAAQISRIKASGAQAVIAWVTGTPFGTVLKSASDNALTIPIMTNAGNLSNVQMLQYGSFLPKDLAFTGFRYQAYKVAGAGPVRDAGRQFISAMSAVGVPNPDGTGQQAWDATLIVVNAFRKLGINATAEQLRAEIAGLHGYAGINGIMDFRDGQQRGLQENAAVIVRWNPAKQNWIPVSKPGGGLL
jgi:branched-chain amino acid transport system substrate-binding protein